MPTIYTTNARTLYIAHCALHLHASVEVSYTPARKRRAYTFCILLLLLVTGPGCSRSRAPLPLRHDSNIWIVDRGPWTVGTVKVVDSGGGARSWHVGVVACWRWQMSNILISNFVIEIFGRESPVAPRHTTGLRPRRVLSGFPPAPLTRFSTLDFRSRCSNSNVRFAISSIYHPFGHPAMDMLLMGLFRCR